MRLQIWILIFASFMRIKVTLQTLINGFAGLEITSQGIVQKHKPVLPKAWKSLIIKGVGIDKKTYIVK
jgi:hypothetical protein